jgi:hypothetical protein
VPSSCTGSASSAALGGPAGALDLVLVGDDGSRIDLSDVCSHEITSVPDHDGQVLGIDPPSGGDRMAEQRAPPDRVQDLGGGRLHPGALTCGEDYDSGRAGRGHADALLRVGVDADRHTHRRAAREEDRCAASLMLPVVKEGSPASVSMRTRQEPICAAVGLA